MKKFNSQDTKEIGDDLGINWDEVNLDEFTIGINVELEHGTRYPDTNVTNNDKKLSGKIAWAHLKEFPDYYMVPNCHLLLRGLLLRATIILAPLQALALLDFPCYLQYHGPYLMFHPFPQLAHKLYYNHLDYRR